MKKYAWAKSEVDAVVRDADKYVDNAETLWNNVVAEGLPRFYHNGEALDPSRVCAAIVNSTSRLNTETIRI